MKDIEFQIISKSWLRDKNGIIENNFGWVSVNKQIFVKELYFDLFKILDLNLQED